MKIDIDELLKILPQLIRENDAVKGAIISALSGVVATHEDIQELIHEMDRRFEAVDRRFEVMQEEIKQIHQEIQQLTQEILDNQNTMVSLKEIVEGSYAELRDNMNAVKDSLESIRAHWENSER